MERGERTNASTHEALVFLILEGLGGTSSPRTLSFISVPRLESLGNQDFYLKSCCSEKNLGFSRKKEGRVDIG